MRNVLGLAGGLLVRGMAVATTLASTVAAQQQATVRDEPSIFRSWIPVLLFTGLIIAIAFKNPKRSHLD